MKIVSKFVLGMYGDFDPIMNKPHYYQPHYKLVTLPAVSLNVKIIRFLDSIFNTGESNLDILKPLPSVTVNKCIL